MAHKTGNSDDVVVFLRRRDYRMVREPGQGACGKTALLYDQQIYEHFVLSPARHKQQFQAKA